MKHAITIFAIAALLAVAVRGKFPSRPSEMSDDGGTTVPASLSA